MIKSIIKKFIPKGLLSFYHLALARLATWYYKNPSDKLIVIGVTGTNGKTTTVNFISQYLECQGQKTGIASTVNFKVGKKEWLNDKKMTMLGRFQTQKLLVDMVEDGCKFAIIETSSQGIEQFRHIGINYDVAVFTNLTPEHIEAHGGFENYRKAKEKLFAHLINCKKKNFFDKKIIISNSDDEETERLRKFKADIFSTYGIEAKADYQAKNINLENGLSFDLGEKNIKTDFLGIFSTYNVLAAIATVDQLGFSKDSLLACKLRGVAGRQEWINKGQDFKVMVDYAPEPTSLEFLYKALENIEKNKLIHVLGSCGGGRDKARQPILGQMAGKNADIVVVTNEDPYDDDPVEIIDNVAKGATKAGKKENVDLFKVVDRVAGIKKALDLAQTGDLVLITGKGSEQFICIADGKKKKHDDRLVVGEYLEAKIS
ncbi:hypothetical protein C0580_03240 [Candidatus Parcubacteria bacterium]|nr:MAG: hypothetical protein C0580_03240 [Candidatus Parcubacteria bacterium]